MDSEVFRTTDEVVAWMGAKGLPIRPQTLVNWRHVGGGPRFHRFGSRVVYSESELNAWLRERLGAARETTSSYGQHAFNLRCAQAGEREESAIIGQTGRVADERATVGTRPQLKRSP